LRLISHELSTKYLVMRRKSNTLTDLELEIMKVVWDHHTVTVRDVHEALVKRRKVAYTTVLTVMELSCGIL
jgi:BlaI family transcriptional regulator, penicillinase repressor